MCEEAHADRVFQIAQVLDRSHGLIVHGENKNDKSIVAATPNNRRADDTCRRS